ncbi:DUF4829 domain-containing protein [Clostridium perfringens]
MKNITYKKFKFIIFMFLILTLLPLTSFNINKNTDNNVIIDIGNSTRFTEEEISKALNVVIDNFEFPACTLTKVIYDEEKSNLITKSYLTNGRGSTNGVIPENVIVVLCNFDVDSSKNNPVFEPNTTYTDFSWTLIRIDKSSNWEIDAQGY